MTTYLTQNPESVEFLERTQRGEAHMNLVLGETDAVEPGVRADYLNVRTALQGLAKDATRSEVSKHAAGKKVAESLIAKIEKAKATIQRRADYLETESLRQADELLGPKPERAHIEGEIRDWIYDQTRAGQAGLDRIRKEMAESEDLARVVYHSPRFLLGLPAETHDVLRFEALQARRPDLYSNIAASMELRKVLPKLDNVIRRVRSSFYNPTLAAQVEKRVEV
jgi:hypothetical protein